MKSFVEESLIFIFSLVINQPERPLHQEFQKKF